MRVGTINFYVYEDGVDYYGLANVALPSLTYKTLTVNGAGIPGDIDFPVKGQRDAAQMTITWLDAERDAYKLCEYRRHTLDLRVARQDYDSTSGKINVVPHKYIVDVMPITDNGGTIAPSSQQGKSVVCTVLAMKEYINGECVREFDPANFRDVDASGTDVLADVRAALGK